MDYMLQLYTSSSFNVIALLSDITGSITGSLDVVFTSDYTNQTSSLTSSVISDNYYIIANIDGASLPTASGLYSANFYSSSILVVNERAFIHGTTQNQLSVYTGSLVPNFYQYNK